MAIYTSEEVRAIWGLDDYSESGIPVTTALRHIKAPYKGFLSKEDFGMVPLSYTSLPIEEDNDAPMREIGVLVEGLTRHLLGQCIQTAFDISPAEYVEPTLEFTDLSDESILLASKMLDQEVELTESHLSDIRTMALRSKEFFHAQNLVAMGHRIKDESASLVNHGIVDFLGNATIWDMKVSKSRFESRWAYQVLLYYLLMRRSSEYAHLRYLGIYNPLYNVAYLKDVETIPEPAIKLFDNEILGYASQTVIEYLGESDIDLSTIDVAALEEIENMDIGDVSEDILEQPSEYDFLFEEE